MSARFDQLIGLMCAIFALALVATLYTIGGRLD